MGGHHGGEKKIGPFKVDGFCQELNTVIEFYGDYWHCHPDQFPDENAIHLTVNPKQAGGGGGIRPQAGSSLCCAETVSSRKLKLSAFTIYQ